MTSSMIAGILAADALRQMLLFVLVLFVRLAYMMSYLFYVNFFILYRVLEECIRLLEHEPQAPPSFSMPHSFDLPHPCAPHPGAAWEQLLKEWY